MAQESYFETRMKALRAKMTKDKNTVEVVLPNVNKPGETVKTKLFSENHKGDIVIHYHQLNGAPYSYRPEGNKWSKSYQRRRLLKPIGDMKYSSPKGEPLHPFFTKNIIDKYNAKTAIETLFFIEGEFKAYAVTNLNVDVVGLGSIHGFYDKKGENSRAHVLHPDLVDLLKVCKVKQVVFCTDADTLVVKHKHNKDLYTRQNSFRTAVVNFYRVMQYYQDDDGFALTQIYFGHLLAKHYPENKGIDDLLFNQSRKRKRITEDLLDLSSSEEEKKYFTYIELSANYYTDLEGYFGLTNATQFFKLYKPYIGRKQFVYRNAKWVQSGDSDSLIFIHHKDVDNFFRIGTDWMKRIKVPNKFGGTDEKIVPFSITEINRDYPDSKYPNFVYKIKRYDAYCNEPDWSTNYSREHHGCYNLANPIQFTPTTGTIAHTLKFLKHIFSGEAVVEEFLEEGKYTHKETAIESDPFTVALDWLTVFYRYPKQMLPVPILVSKEYGTGKSTFLKWLKAIYGTNTAILNNEQFKMRFNAHYITKMLIGIDESFLDIDKKAEKERLKQMVTSDTAYVEHKGVNLQEFPYFGKVVLCSNDADSVMKMDDQENRWFVVKVPKIKVEDKDPDLELKMKEEIPAFLQFLKSRTIAHPRKQRLWFEDKHFITDQFLEIVKNTKTKVEKNIDELLEDLFITYQLETLRLPRKWIIDELNKHSKYKVDTQDVKKYLDDQLGYKLEGPKTIKTPNGFTDGTTTGKIQPNFDSCVSRYYEFTRGDWVEPEISEDKPKNDETRKTNGDKALKVKTTVKLPEYD